MHGTGLEILLQRLAAGDDAAANELLPRIYGELRSLARVYMRRERTGHSLQATALVHEAYLRLLGEHVGKNAPPVESRSHFLALAARAMRQVLVEHARKRSRVKRGGGAEHVQIRTDLGLAHGPDVEILALHEALEILRQEDERQARCVELLYFGGLTAAEAAEVLGTSSRTVERDLRAARVWLQARLEGNLTIPASSPDRDGTSVDENQGVVPRKALRRATRVGSGHPAVDPEPTRRTSAGGNQESHNRAADEIQKKIGRYPILGTLGSGGSGTVFLARDPNLLRTVALKRLSPELATHPEARRRLEEEARALAALQHPNIATVFSLELDDSGTPFLTLEHVDGPSLSELLRESPLPMPRGLQIARQVALALEAAAQLGIVHGDLTPANVLLTRDGQAKVVDFGLARRLARNEIAEPSGDNETPRATIEGIVAGTPGYMSPEQTHGKGPSVAGDVWSFGCLLYEMLNGAAAFPGATVWQRLVSTRQDEPRWDDFERMPMKRLGPLVRQCLAKDPAVRPSSIRVARRFLETELLRLRARKGRSEDVRANPASTRSLPVPADAFVGREEELTLLRDALRSHPIVSILGSGGVGKTRLALEAARDLEQSGTDVLFVDLSRASSLENGLGDAFQIRTSGSQTQAELIEQVLRAWDGLIVLDGCETHRDAVQLFLARANGEFRPKFLMTSRVRMRIPGDRCLEIAPLSLASAAELFRARAAEAMGIAAGTEPNPARAGEATSVTGVGEPRRREETFDDLEQLCRDLDGLPLALELAAARLRTMSFRDLSARVSDLRMLGTSRGDLPERHRDLASLVAWSEQLLPADTQKLFHALGLLAPGWDLEVVEALADTLSFQKWQVIEHLTALIDHSLVVVDRGGSASETQVRYRMLGSVASYAQARCETGETFGTVRRRIVDHYLERVQRESGRIHGPHAVAAMQSLMEDRPNWLRALSWTVSEGDIEVGLRFVVALDPFWRTRGVGHEAREFADTFLALCSGPPKVDGGAARNFPARELDEQAEGNVGRVLHLRATLHLFAGELDAAEQALGRAFEIAQRHGLQDLAARVRNDFGGVALHRERWDEAIEWFVSSLRYAEERQDLRRAAIAHSNLGLVAHRRSDFENARSEYRKALTLAERIEDARLTGAFSGNLAAIALNTGHTEEARAAANESLAIAQRLGDRRHEVAARYVLAVLLFQEGALPEARSELVFVSRTCEAMGNVVTLLGAMSGLALLEEKAGRLELAARVHGHNLRAHEAMNIPVRDSRLKGEVERSYERLARSLGREAYCRCVERGALESVADLLAECGRTDAATTP